MAINHTAKFNSHKNSTNFCDVYDINCARSKHVDSVKYKITFIDTLYNGNVLKLLKMWYTIDAEICGNFNFRGYMQP